MKKIISILLLSIISLSTYAQLDRSVRPKAGPSPELNFGKYKIYQLKNGLKVIVVEDHKLPRVSMNLLIDRDPVQEGKKAGYVSLAGEMLRQGTTDRPKDSLDQQIDFMGASLYTSSNNIYGSGLSKYNEKLMAILADVALHPAFPQEEFDKLKKQQISSLESQQDQPEAVASNVFNAMVYGKDHPYGEITTIETTKNVDLDDCKTYYNNYWVPNNAYLAIVGDIKAKTAKKMAQKYFGDWKEGNIARNVYKTPSKPAHTRVAFVNKDNAVQSVIYMGEPIQLKPGDPDVIRLRLANQILGVGSMGRLFQNIREDKAYTYGAYSDYNDDRWVGDFSANASVRNDVTDSAIVQFLYEFNRLRTEPVDSADMQAAKNAIIGTFGRALEKPQTVANFALNIQRYNLPDDYYETYLDKLQKLNTQDVMDAAKKYITPDSMDIVVVGKATEVADKLKKFGDFNYYTPEAEVTTAPTIPIPAGVTADSVVMNYIKAIGGKENLKKVKDLKITMEVEIPGAPMTMKATDLRKRPDMYKSVLEMPGRGVLQEQVYDGKKGIKGGMMGQQELEGDDLTQLKEQAQFDNELNYLNGNYKIKLTQISKVGDEKAYVMEITDPTGDKTTEYYSVDSGLKLKAESTENTEKGPVTTSQTFSDYKEMNGVKYPYKTVVNAGGQKITLTVTDLQVNKGIKDSEFKP